MNAVTSDVPGIFRQDDGTPIPFPDAKYEWAHAGYDMLVGIARTPDGLVTYAEIADTVQEATGIRTRQPMHDWIHTPLTLVAEMCVRNGEPQLTGLVVAEDTLEVGDSFAASYAIAGQPLPKNLQRAAAATRIACYDHFSRREAVGWDKAKLTWRIGVARSPVQRSAPEPKPRTERPQTKVCTQCHLELLPNGRCGYCD